MDLHAERMDNRVAWSVWKLSLHHPRRFSIPVVPLYELCESRPGLLSLSHSITLVADGWFSVAERWISQSVFYLAVTSDVPRNLGTQLHDKKTKHSVKTM
jgi:hypothetical protein